MAHKFSTTSRNFRELIGNGQKYVVPPFQRDYSWERDQWEDLWEDCWDIYTQAEESHYMGYLVLQESAEGTFMVIDGQQRLTTLSIWVLAAIQVIHKLNETLQNPQNEERVKILRNTYIGGIDVASLQTYNKLQLNRNDNPYYADYISTLARAPIRRQANSHKLMQKALVFFADCFTSKALAPEEIGRFVDLVSTRLVFTIIHVDSELNAFKVFETLNARGVKLSTSDLLKNYIFSVISKSDSNAMHLERAEHLWATIQDKLEHHTIEEYIKCYWNSKHKLTRKAELFKRIRHDIQDPTNAFAFLNALGSAADYFVAIQSETDPLWHQHSAIAEKIKIINLFRLKQHLPAALACVLADTEHFKILDRFLGDLIVVSFRYQIIGGQNPNEMERVLTQLAVSVSQSGRYDRKLLQEVYPSDDAFVQDFSEKELSAKPAKKLIKYMFVEMENKLYRQSLNWEDVDLSIEHILPQSANAESWPNWLDADIDHHLEKLGNYALLHANANRKLSNSSFEEKRPVYAESKLSLTSDIAKYEEWTAAQLKHRQRTLAKQAAQTWRLDFV
jgi:hypothetical protein